MTEEVVLEGGGRSQVFRKEDIVYRPVEAWTESVHALLRHLENSGFSGSPRLAGSGYDDQGREMLTYIDGDFVHPRPWTDEGAHAVGLLLRTLHDATRTFVPPENAIWRDLYLRSIRQKNMVYGHGDFTPWNLISKNGIPFAVIDWETAGPVDAMVELAQVCWLNAQLCDDDVAERAGLASGEKRIQQARIIVDAYGMPMQDRAELVDTMIEVAIRDAAEQAIEAKVTPETTDIEPLWGLAWRTRAAAWMIRNRQALKQAVL